MVRWGGRHVTARRTIAAVAVIALLVGLVPGLVQPNASAQSSTTPIVFVHGANIGACPGNDAGQIWATAISVMRGSGWLGTSDVIGYYRCDTNYTTSIGQFDNTTPIEDISQALAWHIY